MNSEAALLESFVEHIRTHKVVHLEQLAAAFRLRTADALARVRALEAEGRLTGVLDERGKFIHISPDEMAAVAAFITRRGRVSIAELAARSGDFIQLAPAHTAEGGAETEEAEVASG